MKKERIITFSGVRQESKKISWIKKKTLAQNTATVVLFCLLMSGFFFGADAIIASIFRLLGMN